MTGLGNAETPYKVLMRTDWGHWKLFSEGQTTEELLADVRTAGSIGFEGVLVYEIDIDTLRDPASTSARAADGVPYPEPQIVELGIPDGVAS